jgi:1,2-diacylglycerol 3-alpha-glucosyltransferase
MEFVKQGHEVTLVAGKEYEPTTPSTLPIKVLYFRSAMPWLFVPSLLPFHPQLIPYLRKHKNEFDVIISSDIFSINSFLAATIATDKTILWNEQGKHNRKFFKIPSLIWYQVVVRLCMQKVRVTSRSPIAERFALQFGMNVLPVVIDHGIDERIFYAQCEKEPFFIISARLDAYKNVLSILVQYKRYTELYPDAPHRLYIAGSDAGELERLQAYVVEHQLEDQVVFLGRVSQTVLADYMRRATCMLCNSLKESNMISIDESIASGTPVITNTVPYSYEWIKQYQLGIAKDNWTAEDIHEVVRNNSRYVTNCIAYAPQLSLSLLPQKFIQLVHS